MASPSDAPTDIVSAVQANAGDGSESESQPVVGAPADTPSWQIDPLPASCDANAGPESNNVPSQADNFAAGAVACGAEGANDNGGFLSDLMGFGDGPLTALGLGGGAAASGT
eukprot:1241535-Pleurochrysis_carterae.AAC.1